MLKFDVKPDKDSDAITIETNLPETWEAADQVFTREEQYAHMIANAIVKAQGIVRAHYAKIAAGKESKLPTDWVDAVKPQARLSTEDRVKRDLAKLDPAMLKAMLEELVAKGKKGK